jgi:transposase
MTIDLLASSCRGWRPDLLADRGYDADWTRELAATKCAWAKSCRKATAPIRSSPYLYRARNRVERFFTRIKHTRRIAARCDELAANHLAFVRLASIRQWLRPNESMPYSSMKETSL